MGVFPPMFTGGLTEHRLTKHSTGLIIGLDFPDPESEKSHAPMVDTQTTDDVHTRLK